METFDFKVRWEMSTEYEPKVNVVTFGDGYEQRSARGINNNLSLRSCTVIIPRSDDREFKRLTGFLNRHAGYKAFYWTPPDTKEKIIVVCEKWKYMTSGVYYEFEFSLREVVG
ncbi:phage tail protein [Pasteurellaceae bacterium TAE3-ERU1]|nr:phage tail protein [Pasteurellaceae bacterium TAE3-ERU1]